ncbi:hypothetical protein Acr_11g0011930 [Actinidia rufa]|uniref:Uncharacterized protein n=1 Tax=Actinidia rufa TaxID=165716 RepID=A0A7J0FG58_9ERIC|nr:hypothetical protein Acr_11g0011930 [Actinidia rufa]
MVSEPRPVAQLLLNSGNVPALLGEDQPADGEDQLPTTHHSAKNNPSTTMPKPPSTKNNPPTPNTSKPSMSNIGRQPTFNAPSRAPQRKKTSDPMRVTGPTCLTRVIHLLTHPAACISATPAVTVSAPCGSRRLSHGLPTLQFHQSIRYLPHLRLPKRFGIIWLSNILLLMAPNHLAQFEPTWTYSTDVVAFYAYRYRSLLRHFLMALPPDYEHTRASLIHPHRLPTIGQALTELRLEETRKKTMAYHQHS